MFVCVYVCVCVGTGLQLSKALIAVVTTKYLNSKFCTNELYAASSDQKDIFPVILEQIDFNASERARGVKYVISSINWTLFGSGYDYGTSLEHLVQGMKRSGLGVCVFPPLSLPPSLPLSLSPLSPLIISK